MITLTLDTTVVCDDGVTEGAHERVPRWRRCLAGVDAQDRAAGVVEPVGGRDRCGHRASVGGVMRHLHFEVGALVASMGFIIWLVLR